MPVDFHLSPEERAIRAVAAAFASGPLMQSKETYMKLQHHHERFQATRPVYRAAVAAGLIKGQIPPHLGGTGGSLLEAAIMVEEMYAVEPSAALTIFGTGLGLTPINLTGKPEHERYLAPFLSGEGEPLASLVFSEPGGVANWLEKGAPGLATTAELQGNRWVLNGDKVHSFLPSPVLDLPPLPLLDLVLTHGLTVHNIDLGYQLRGLGLPRCRPPMRRLSQRQKYLFFPVQRSHRLNHDPPRHQRRHPSQRPRRLPSRPPYLHRGPYILLRSPRPIHQPFRARRECPLPSRYRCSHRIGQLRLLGRSRRRHERGHHACGFRRRVGVRQGRQPSRSDGSAVTTGVCRLAERNQDADGSVSGSDLESGQLFGERARRL